MTWKARHQLCQRDFVSRKLAAVLIEQRHCPPWQHGRSLLEMLIVVALIGLVAAVAVPSIDSTHQQRLALSTSEVGDAFRFAREETRRTGMMHGVSIDIPTNRARVFRLDEGPNPNIRVFDVRHPLTKQLYTVQLGGVPYNGISFSNYSGQVVGTCPTPGDMAFDTMGVVRCTEPVATRFITAAVELTSGQSVQSINIDGYTGGVIVQ